MQVSDIISYLGDRIIYIAGVFAGIPVIYVAGRWMIGWYWDKRKRENASFLEWQINLLQENSMAPIFIIEARTLKLFKTNKACRRLFSAGKEHFENRNYYRLIEPSELNGFLHAIRNAIKDQSSFTYETGCVLPDSTKLRMVWELEPFIEMGATRALGGSVRINHRRQTIHLSGAP